ncbi:hypothetical protein LZY01_15840 [Levilactobacillus zymae]|uniref:Uncharacterized protein n=1 Tax=Levilactobacillus zymae TaxID=267363 RepID=A0ABQ0WXI8_9LACO|nr:hypothetical protein LZY01_15840 [Levilactobacillus zymae]
MNEYFSDNIHISSDYQLPSRGNAAVGHGMGRLNFQSKVVWIVAKREIQRSSIGGKMNKWVS